MALVRLGLYSGFVSAFWSSVTQCLTKQQSSIVKCGDQAYLLFQLASQVLGLICLSRFKQILQLQLLLVTLPQEIVHPPGEGKDEEFYIKRSFNIYQKKLMERIFAVSLGFFFCLILSWVSIVSLPVTEEDWTWWMIMRILCCQALEILLFVMSQEWISYSPQGILYFCEWY